MPPKSTVEPAVQQPEEVVQPDWSPQRQDENGVFMAGDYPANHRLRAEALAKARRKSDPDGIISDDLIEQAGARLRAEREGGNG